MNALYSTHFQIDVRYADTDMAGVVHHAKFLEYYEAARIHLLDTLECSYTTLQNHQIGFVPVDINIKFIRPLKFGYTLDIHTHLLAVHNASLHINANIMYNGNTHSSMNVKLACLDEKNWKIRKLPPLLTQNLIALSQPHQ